MKILIYGLNYAPELAGVGKYTGELAQMMVDRGHGVRVVCAPPYFPDWRVPGGYSALRYRHHVLAGAEVWRAPLWVPKMPGGVKRVLHLASFALTSLPLLVRQIAWRPDVILLVVPTLFCSPGALLLARCTGAISWLHIQDYEVDAAFELGLLKGKWASRIARSLEGSVLRRFDLVSSISERMVARALDKGVAPSRAVCLPNWVDTAAIYPLPRPSHYRSMLGIAPEKTVVLYSGSIGAKQGIETLADVAAALVSREDIHFVFCGNGAGRAALAERCARLSNCSLLPLQPVESLNELLNVADIHVLPQRSDAADLVMPSKLTGMLASGRPVVAMTRRGTSLFDAIEPDGEPNGVAVPPEDSDALAAAIVALADAPQRRRELGAAARAYAQRHLSPESIFGQLDVRLAGKLVARVRGVTGEAAPLNVDMTPVRPGDDE